MGSQQVLSLKPSVLLFWYLFLSSLSLYIRYILWCFSLADVWLYLFSVLTRMQKSSLKKFSLNILFSLIIDGKPIQMFISFTHSWKTSEDKTWEAKTYTLIIIEVLIELLFQVIAVCSERKLILIAFTLQYKNF